jgi:hypothetical protein
MYRFTFTGGQLLAPASFSEERAPYTLYRRLGEPQSKYTLYRRLGWPQNLRTHYTGGWVGPRLSVHIVQEAG